MFLSSIFHLIRKLVYSFIGTLSIQQIEFSIFDEIDPYINVCDASIIVPMYAIQDRLCDAFLYDIWKLTFSQYGTTTSV